MDLKFMKRALDLAKLGEGYTNPNPLVGAVIVKNDKIIGEGYHQLYGSHHAEVNAFLNATEDVEGATMYVTLEPCSHYGKTPPCAKLIVEKKIKKVFIGLKDPNPLVSGKGIQMLQEAGIEVVSGILEEEGRKLNEIFLKFITKKLPFCIMKTAMTLDGKIATSTGDSKWVTNEASRNYVHLLRNRVAGIMVGIGTVLADDPELTTRLGDTKGSDAIRIIVDSTAKIPLDAKVLNLSSNKKTMIAVTEKAEKEKCKAIEEKGAEVICIPSKDNKVDLSILMKELGTRNIDSILLEGGGELNFTAIQEGLVDKINAFIAPKIIGGNGSKTMVGGQGFEKMVDAKMIHRIDIHRFEDDIMIEGYFGKET